jgi:hypothetical protein
MQFDEEEATHSNRSLQEARHDAHPCQSQTTTKGGKQPPTATEMKPDDVTDDVNIDESALEGRTGCHDDPEETAQPRTDEALNCKEQPRAAPGADQAPAPQPGNERPPTNSPAAPPPAQACHQGRSKFSGPVPTTQPSKPKAKARKQRARQLPKPQNCTAPSTSKQTHIADYLITANQQANPTQPPPPVAGQTKCDDVSHDGSRRHPTDQPSAQAADETPTPPPHPAASAPAHFILNVFNVRGWRTQSAMDLCEHLQGTKDEQLPHIIALTETKLTPRETRQYWIRGTCKGYRALHTTFNAWRNPQAGVTLLIRQQVVDMCTNVEVYRPDHLRGYVLHVKLCMPQSADVHIIAVYCPSGHAWTNKVRDQIYKYVKHIMDNHTTAV